MVLKEIFFCLLKYEVQGASWYSYEGDRLYLMDDNSDILSHYHNTILLVHLKTHSYIVLL